MKKLMQTFVAAIFAAAILGVSVSANYEEFTELQLEITTSAVIGSFHGEIANGITIPPYDGMVNFHVAPINMCSNSFFDEKIYWQFHPSRNVGDRMLRCDLNFISNVIWFSDSQVRRRITITASLYYDRDVYYRFTFVVDPRQPTLEVLNAEDVYFTQGTAQESLIIINTQNLPDGVYNAYINGMPNDIHVIGWSETYELGRTVYGEIEIKNGKATITFINKPSEYNAVAGRHHLTLGIENVWHESIFPIYIKPKIMDIQITYNQFAVLPDSGSVSFWPDIYCVLGTRSRYHSSHQLIDWTIAGAAEGDFFQVYFFGGGRLYIGSSTEKRIIVITASATTNPEVYATVTILVDDDFEFIPTNVDIRPHIGVVLTANVREIESGFAVATAWKFTTDSIYIVLDGYDNDTGIVAVTISDDYNNQTRELDYITFTLDGNKPGDTLIINDDVAYFKPDADSTVRVVTVTAAYYTGIYDYLNILVVPDAGYLPHIYIANVEDFTVTLHANNVPDGYHQVHLNIRPVFSYNLHMPLWEDMIHVDRWMYIELVEFIDGVGLVTLDNDGVVLSEMYFHVLNLYWEAWIEEIGVTANGAGSFDLRGL